MLAVCVALALLPLASGRLRHAVCLAVASHWFALRPAEVVWCGDSLLEELPSSLARARWGAGREFNLARAGASVSDLVAQLAQARPLRTSRLVVMAGTNDLARPDAQWVASWRLLLRAAPGPWGARRIVIAQPWTADTHYDALVLRRNALLAAMAHENGWHFVDPNPALLDRPVSRSRLFRDARHFSGEGYERWFALVVEQL